MKILQNIGPGSSRAVLGLLALLLSVSVGAQTAGSGTPASNSAVVARGPDGVIVTVADLLAELQRAPVADRNAALAQPETVKQIANNLLVRRALAAEAERDKLASDPLVAAAVVIARDRVMSDARLAKLDIQNSPSEAALDAYARNLYQVSGARFEKPATTHARHILLANTGAESLDRARQLVAQLRAGASFDELAKANSTDAGSAARGGDLGFFEVGRMVRPFDDAVNALKKPGDISDPVETQFGYHIIRLDERREKHIQPYDEVKGKLFEEARIALMNESRITKVQSLNQNIVYEQAVIDSLASSSPH